MEVEVTQENLAKALSTVGRIASSKAGLPILNNILLRSSGKQLLVAATNLEMAATQLIGAKIVKAGSVTVPARLVTEFVQNLPKDTVTLTVKNNKLHIASGANSSIINGMGDEEFPELPVIDDKKAVTYTLSPADFKQAVSQTIITASSDSTRPVLTGVYWHTHEKHLYLAATDGYRLSEKKLIKVTNDISAIVPVTTLQEVLRTITDHTEQVEVLFDETQVRFRLDESEVTSRLIDGNFPDYRSLIPASSETKSELSKDELLRVVKMANLFARDMGGTITISPDADKDTVVISSIASELGENTSEVPASISGASASVNLNSRYLIEALNVVEEGSVSFEFSGKLAPCVIRPIGESGDYTHIIMPIKS